MRILRPIFMLLWVSWAPCVVHSAPEAPAEERHPFAVEFPPVQLRNQEGADVRWPEALAAHDIVLMNFLFTSCSTICPITGQNIADLSKALETAGVERVGVYSITLDPTFDTPLRLKKWAAQFQSGRNWSLLTGAPAEVNKVLKACKAFVPDKTAHAPFVLIGSPARKQWLRIDGTPSADEVLRSIAALRPPAAPATAAVAEDAAQTYFTNVELTNQDGKKRRLYTDLLKDRVVVMTAFFATCNGICTVSMPRLKELQGRLAATNLSERVHLLSFTVDPDTDTTAMLKKYSEALGAKPGWEFLTGDMAVLETALAKLGFKSESKETHGSAFIVGNVSTGHLAKVPGYVPLPQLEALVHQMLEEEK